MARFSLFFLFCALLCGTALSQFLPFGDCKSKSCGIQQGPFGPVFFGGGCKSKGCPVPPGLDVPGIPTEPLPPAPPVCCTPDGCLNGYRTECLVGALTPSLRTQGFFTASGSCTGSLRKFNCQSAESVCSGNRQRCEFRRCPGTPPTAPPVPPRPRPSPPTPPGPKSKPHPPHPYRMLSAGEGEEPVIDTEDPYFQLIDRMINISKNVPQDMLPVEMRQFGFGGFGACKSKGCPFGVFPNGNVPAGGQFFLGAGDCKSKGCGIVPGPFGPIYKGGSCKSKGCPVPPGFEIPGGPPPPPPPVPTEEPQLPPAVPPFSPPGRRQCCFARPCETQRICRCVLNQ